MLRICLAGLCHRLTQHFLTLLYCRVKSIFLCQISMLSDLPFDNFCPRLSLHAAVGSENDCRRTGEGKGLLLWKAERHWTHLPGTRKQPSPQQNHGHTVCYRGKQDHYHTYIKHSKFKSSSLVQMFVCVRGQPAVCEFIKLIHRKKL